MIEQGVSPNAHSFSAVISACAKAGDLVAACQHLADMTEAGVPADVVVYGCVLDACASKADAPRAKRIFEQMKAQGVKPNVVAYASLARPSARKGDWQEVERIQAEMEGDGVPLNDYFLHALLSAYASARPRQSARAEATFRHAISRGVEVNVHVLGARARVVGRGRCNELAQEMCPSAAAALPRE